MVLLGRSESAADVVCCSLGCCLAPGVSGGLSGLARDGSLSLFGVTAGVWAGVRSWDLCGVGCSLRSTLFRR